MASRRINAWALPLAALAAGCVPLQKSTTTQALGRGVVLSLRSVTVQPGFSRAENMLIGAAAAGVTGLVITAQEEATVGSAHKFEYSLRMADGSTQVLQSFSIAAEKNCVAVTRVGDNPDVVLERVACNG